MDDLQLREELVSMLNGGHDTVTDAISWTMILLARHPGIKGTKSNPSPNRENESR